MSTVSIPLKCVFKELWPIEIFDLTPLTFKLYGNWEELVVHTQILTDIYRAFNSLQFSKNLDFLR